MLRTSRCFAGRLFQLGGPDALLSVTRHPYQFRFADFSFAPTQALVFNAVCQSGPSWYATTQWSTELNLRNRENLAAQFAAIIG
jgi:hypothetical protein